MKKPKYDPAALEEIQRMNGRIEDVERGARQLFEKSQMWERRAREALDVLHAFSAPMTAIILKNWDAGR